MTHHSAEKEDDPRPGSSPDNDGYDHDFHVATSSNFIMSQLSLGRDRPGAAVAIEFSLSPTPILGPRSHATL